VETWERRIEIAKTDEDQCLVFGWLSRVVDANGAEIVDQQGDIIPVAELERAAYEFMLDSRSADVMHDEAAIGKAVESFVSTPEKRAAMGAANDDQSVGWWVGFRVAPETMAKVKAGLLAELSIGGSAQRVPVDAA